MNKALFLLPVLAIGLAACSPQADPTPTSDPVMDDTMMMEEGTMDNGTMMEGETMEDGTMTDDEMMMTPTPAM